MNTNLKKFLIILIIVLIIALVFWLVYNSFIKKPSDEEVGSNGQSLENGSLSENEELTPNPELKLRAVSTEKILAPTLSIDKTKVMYYSQYNGNVWQSNFNGLNLTRISGSNLENLIEIIWSPDKSKVISIYQNDLGDVDKYSYNFENGESYLFSKHIQNIIWLSNSSQIAYQYTNKDTNNNNITFANFDGTSWQNIFQTRINDLNLNWLDPEIAFYEKPSGLTQASLFVFNSLTKNLSKILSDEYGMSVKWSPQKDKILYSKTNNSGKNIKLFVASSNGANSVNTNISSLVEKCVWLQDNRSLFCAIPKNIEKADILPDDFYKGKFIGDDEFWKINLETGEKTILLERWERGDGTYDAVNLFLSPLEDYLFFVNKKDGLLYSIEL